MVVALILLLILAAIVSRGVRTLLSGLMSLFLGALLLLAGCAIG